MFTGMDLTQIL